MNIRSNTFTFIYIYTEFRNIIDLTEPLKMIEVEVRGDLEYAIRQLKKKLQIDGIKRELKRRECYEKPSVKKRRKEAEARRKLRKFNRIRRG